MKKKVKKAKAVEVVHEIEAASESGAPMDEMMEQLAPGEYVRVVNGKKWLAFKDARGVCTDLRQL